MRLTLRRLYQHPTCVQGVLDLDGVTECFTLEDSIREIHGEPVEKWKVKGQTAISAGVYTVVVDWSNRFQRTMPHLLDVEGFSGIRIHSGNTSHDTEGCILVGQTRENDTTVGHSHAAFNELFPKLEAATDPITIEIINPPETVEEHQWALPT